MDRKPGSIRAIRSRPEQRSPYKGGKIPLVEPSYFTNFEFAVAHDLVIRGAGILTCFSFVQVGRATPLKWQTPLALLTGLSENKPVKNTWTGNTDVPYPTLDCAFA